MLCVLLKTSCASFNPRVLAGGRDLQSGAQLALATFQSTRPRGRTRLTPDYFKFYRSYVSIHASSREDATTGITLVKFLNLFQSTRPRGRTRRNRHAFHTFDKVSIHASSREDATVITRWFPAISCFNPRVLAGGRDPLAPCV